MRRPTPDPVGPGQESVWDYPRPPRLEPVTAHLEIVLGGVTIASTTAGFRVLETSHPPVYYFPPDDIASDALIPVDGTSYCEYKGSAHYFDVRGGGVVRERVAWAYPNPTAAFVPITDYVAFYAAPMDACYVDEERVVPQPGGFYGGWITDAVVGPFKGVDGSQGW